MTPAWAWPLTILGALGWAAAGATGIVLYAVLTRTHHGPDQAYQTIPSTDEKPPAEGSGHTGAPAQAPPPPGHAPGAGAVPHSPAPAPGLTQWDRGVLTDLDHAGIPPLGRDNGREIADMARRMIPHLDDRDLGRVLLHAYWWAATFNTVLPPVEALCTVLDALGGAALDLTALDRETTP